MTLVILKKCLKINWFSALPLYSVQARKKSQDGEFPTVTPFFSGKLSHLIMMRISPATGPSLPRQLSSTCRSSLLYSGDSGGILCFPDHYCTFAGPRREWVAALPAAACDFESCGPTVGWSREQQNEVMKGSLTGVPAEEELGVRGSDPHFPPSAGVFS